MKQPAIRIACLGGLYSNYLALEAALRDAQKRGAEEVYCLGDLGAFGPYPNRVFPLLREHEVRCMQGNYDHSIGTGLADCQCGYTDPRDNYFAKLSYDYTFQNTSWENRRWLSELPSEIRLDWDGVQVLMCHGSPRKTNEFLWESTTSTHFLADLAQQHQADLLLGTHTGLKWQRALPQRRQFVNVGVLGRPENDGQTHVWYTLIDYLPPNAWKIEFVPVVYDHQRLANEMAAEKLPSEFIETIVTGWWTTCLEILPSKERRCGKY